MSNTSIYDATFLSPENFILNNETNKSITLERKFKENVYPISVFSINSLKEDKERFNFREITRLFLRDVNTETIFKEKIKKLSYNLSISEITNILFPDVDDFIQNKFSSLIYKHSELKNDIINMFINNINSEKIHELIFSTLFERNHLLFNDFKEICYFAINKKLKEEYNLGLSHKIFTHLFDYSNKERYSMVFGGVYQTIRMIEKYIFNTIKKNDWNIRSNIMKLELVGVIDYVVSNKCIINEDLDNIFSTLNKKDKKLIGNTSSPINVRLSATHSFEDKSTLVFPVFNLPRIMKMINYEDIKPKFTTFFNNLVDLIIDNNYLPELKEIIKDSDFNKELLKLENKHKFFQLRHYNTKKDNEMNIINFRSIIEKNKEFIINFDDRNEKLILTNENKFFHRNENFKSIQGLLDDFHKCSYQLQSLKDKKFKDKFAITNYIQDNMLLKLENNYEYSKKIMEYTIKHELYGAEKSIEYFKSDIKNIGNKLYEINDGIIRIGGLCNLNNDIINSPNILLSIIKEVIKETDDDILNDILDIFDGNEKRISYIFSETKLIRLINILVKALNNKGVKHV